ncbi:tripartite tricarboxylate transporter substrate binding protein [Paraburkholderia sp. JHI869]|uniref:tripartite tricarboxylate transporter substrate binding protein n=1 Tax=Paraburkholderia sp. JHI869 TaxID=3112959 RepID=UPI003178EA48
MQVKLWKYAAILLLATAGAARAEQPTIPSLIRIIVPVPPGASNDLLARVVAPQLAARLHTNVIVENLAGASGMIGASAVANGPHDGSMLLLFSKSLVSANATMRHPTVDVVHDLEPVAGILQLPLVIAASNQSGIKTPADLLTVGRAKHGGLNHGNGGIGSVAHITSEMLGEAGNFPLNNIAYKGGAPALIDLASGVIDFAVTTHSAVDGLAKAGRVRLVAVCSRDRSPNYPNLPTMDSVLPGFVQNLWIGVWTTKGVAPALVERYNHELIEIAKSAEVHRLDAVEDGSPLSWTASEFGAQVRESYDHFKRVATDKHIVTD